jgi:predicted secreted protein
VAPPRLKAAHRGALAALAVALLCAGLAGCARPKIYGESTPTITAAVGEQVVIELAADPVTGFSWSFVGRPDPLVVTLMTSDFALGTSNASAGHQRWMFRIVGRGSTKVQFNYGRTWHTSSERTTTFTIVGR